MLLHRGKNKVIINREKGTKINNLNLTRKLAGSNFSPVYSYSVSDTGVPPLQFRGGHCLRAPR